LLRVGLESLGSTLASSAGAQTQVRGIVYKSKVGGLTFNERYFTFAKPPSFRVCG